MQLFGSANVNRMAIGGKLVSYSETFVRRLDGKSWEKPWNSRQPIEKQAIITRRECPKTGTIWAVLYGASVHDIWCKRGTKVTENLRINGTGN